MDKPEAPSSPIADGSTSSPAVNPAFRNAIAVLAVLALALLLWQLRPVLLLLFAAALVAIVLDALARVIQKRTNIPHAPALAISALTIFGGVGSVVWLFGAELAAQGNELAALIPGGWDALSARFGEERLNDIVERLTPTGGNIFSIVQSDRKSTR